MNKFLYKIFYRKAWPEITKDTLLSEIKKIHRRIWNYVIKHGEKPDTPYVNDCVLCAYNLLSHDVCENCVVKWSAKVCHKKGSEYNVWINESDPNKKRLFAKKIRDIEFKNI